MSKRLIFILFLFLFVNSALVVAQQNVEVHLFYGQGCQHCEKAIVFFDKIKDKYPNMNLNKHETYFDNEERELFFKITQKYNRTIEGVPTIFVGDQVFVGYNDAIGVDIELAIIDCAENGCENPLSGLVEDNNAEDDTREENNSVVKSVTIPAVISAALVDAINPCAFAVLIILLTTILVSKNRRRALFAGLAFTIAIFMSYFLMGLGLYSAINAAGVSRTFYYVVAALAIILGLFNLKDYLWYGKWFVMEVPRKWRPKMKSLIKGVTSVPGAFLIGFVVSLFLLPCTSGPYIVTLGLLSEVATRNYAILLLLLYNVVFVIPMIVITLGVYFGFTTTEKLEKIRQNKLKVLHLISGIIILLLGIGMLIAINLGLI